MCRQLEEESGEKMTCRMWFERGPRTAICKDWNCDQRHETKASYEHKKNERVRHSTSRANELVLPRAVEGEENEDDEVATRMKTRREIGQATNVEGM